MKYIVNCSIRWKTETKDIKQKTIIQNSVVMFGIFIKNHIVIVAFMKQFD